jgi:hypothetical protein
MDYQFQLKETIQYIQKNIWPDKRPKRYPTGAGAKSRLHETQRFQEYDGLDRIIKPISCSTQFVVRRVLIEKDDGVDRFRIHGRRALEAVPD